MKRNFFSITLLLTLFLCSITSQAQFGIEVNYGLNGVTQPSITNISHFGGGILYDFDETFGAKLDFGSDKFRTDNLIYNKESGINITRFSLQGTVNISDLIDPTSLYSSFNLSGHLGGGYSFIKSTEHKNNDNTVNAIIGLTPKIKITQGLYFAIDASVIFNLSQHYGFDGEFTYDNYPNSITGIMYNVTGGLIYKFNEYY
ncbi:conserved exported hypothetical protein [Flavobacterium sp. 9AF]|uniref:hypothetical protein n=1 Tax=Flavobacterium sp. 9AF TaxID=2653142 RepID=UPI0012F3AF9F|nr:hypothetical protein [Flavobacterium sp. 9AF]VXB51950.1 conserved exported hypothetical protein [Flavobacterium sp. 9AF]